MRRSLLRLLGVFVVVVLVALAGVALWASVGTQSGSGGGAPDGERVAGQSPAQFQPDALDRDTDPETGEISVAETDEPKRILVDTRHDNELRRADLEPMIEAAFRAGHTVEFIGSGEQVDDYNETLRPYDALLVVQPTDEFSAGQRRALRDYTAGGGRVIVLAEPTQTEPGGPFTAPTTTSFGATNLTRAYGVQIGAEMLYNLDDDANDNNFKSIYAEPTAQSPLTRGVERVTFDGGGYVAVASESDASVEFTSLPGTTTLQTRRPGEYPTVARNGNFVFVADSSFIQPSEVYDADNEVFVGNLLTFLVSGDKPPDVPRGAPDEDGENGGNATDSP